MPNNNKAKSSIVKKLTRYILAIIIIQTVIFSGALIGGGVINQANLNAYQLFSDKVNSRQDYLQREMKNKWINFNPYFSNIKKMLDNDQSLDVEITEELIKIIRNTQVTGAYVVLFSGNNIEDHLPAVYLRDYDPVMNSYSDDDIYMLAGSSNVAKQLKLPLDQIWKPFLQINDANRDFIEKPSDSTEVTNKTNLLGYWSKPFQLEEGDVDIITYSMPFLDNEGNIQGVFGIEVTLNYLVEHLPKNELQPQDSLGYLIAYRSNEDEELYPIIMNGALQIRMIDENLPLELSLINEDMNIYQLTNHRGSENIYVVVEKLGLYKTNTPFENEEWFLIGTMREDYLFSNSSDIKQILLFSIALAIILGSVGGVLISFQITKPIVNLAKEVKANEAGHQLSLHSTGYQELDELSSSIENAHKMIISSAARLSKIVNMFQVPIAAYEINKSNNAYYVTDNFWEIIGKNNKKEYSYSQFVEELNVLFSNPDKGENIFKIKNAENTWVEIKQSETKDYYIGVVVDVSKEILEKKQIEYDRDHDPLTNILNRKGFQWEFEKWYENEIDSCSALIMFDLDHLKDVNDVFGHKWGDYYIINFVNALKAINDENHCIVGRRSGDEFVCLLYNFKSQDEIRNTVDRLYMSLKETPVEFPKNATKHVRVSGGLIWIKDKSLSYDKLLHYADEKLYEAKTSNKGTYLESHRT